MEGVMEIPQEDLEAVRKRLARVQGQLGGIIRMLDEGRECTDVLTQLAAANSAINKAASHSFRYRQLWSGRSGRKRSSKARKSIFGARL